VGNGIVIDFTIYMRSAVYNKNPYVSYFPIYQLAIVKPYLNIPEEVNI